jgi:hypothetical protein
MTAVGLALRLGISEIEARELLRRHRNTYRRFWSWVEDIVSSAMLNGFLHTTFGWPIYISGDTKLGTVQNFPAQANGAETMRIGAIGGTEAGFEICCPVHDAFLQCAPIDRLTEDVAAMREIMRRASMAVTGGLEIRTDVKLVLPGERYSDERGAVMWARINNLLTELERKAA